MREIIFTFQGVLVHAVRAASSGANRSTKGKHILNQRLTLSGQTREREFHLHLFVYRIIFMLRMPKKINERESQEIRLYRHNIVSLMVY